MLYLLAPFRVCNVQRLMLLVPGLVWMLLYIGQAIDLTTQKQLFNEWIP